MNFLVIGGGGREHTIAWKLAQSTMVDKVFCAPGNPLFKGIESVNITEIPELIAFAKENNVGLTMVGPEQPLCEGIVNDFRAEGLAIFGPDKEAAQLEGSKSYAKDFMFRHGLPTGASETFENATDARAYVEKVGAPIVIKADGLAAGKGVIVAETLEDALAAVDTCFTGFGKAGERVVVEECLFGEEASILAFVDGNTIKPLASSQDHKRRFEGDLGPNTGGMGSYSPAPVVTDEVWETIDTTVLKPFLKGCQADNLDFKGIVFIGLMIDNGIPKVLEFNVRFGDPETQSVLSRMKSDLAEAMLATVEQRLDGYEFQWEDKHAVCVVLASGGYPASAEKGFEISGIDEAEAAGTTVFQAGTKAVDGKPVTNGGRVLGVTALGDSIAEAVENAYKGVDKISWTNMVYRTDIAHRALRRQSDAESVKIKMPLRFL